MRTSPIHHAVIALICAAGMVAGCRRSPAPTPSGAEQPATPIAMPAGAPPAAPASQGGATRATHDANYIQEMTSTLNDFLADYTRQHKRVPKDINEMVRLQLITSIPVLPDGKQWVINQQTGKISAQ